MTETDTFMLTLGTWALIACAFMVLITLFTMAWIEIQRRKPLFTSREEIDWPRSWAEVSSGTDTPQESW